VEEHYEGRHKHHGYGADYCTYKKGRGNMKYPNAMDKTVSDLYSSSEEDSYTTSQDPSSSIRKPSKKELRETSNKSQFDENDESMRQEQITGTNIGGSMGWTGEDMNSKHQKYAMTTRNQRDKKKAKERKEVYKLLFL
jgi:hypothetical protein